MDEHKPRTLIFISHATPEDNAFVRWLGAKLTALGYEVWADLFALRGGSDWSRKLEHILRHRAAKMLVVCTSHGLEKQGVRNEIEIATQVSTAINDPEFIIPLRLASYEAPFRTAHLQHIDFANGWANGLVELSELLATNNILPRSSMVGLFDEWLLDQTKGSTKLVERIEYLTSNWLQIASLPPTLYHCEPLPGVDRDRFHQRKVDEWPSIPFKSGALTFARPNTTGEAGHGVRARIIDQVPLKDFLRDGWPKLAIERYAANRHFSDLGNQAFDLFMYRRRMSALTSAKGRRTWWGDIRRAPKRKVSFNWRHAKGLRQIMGQSEKRGIFWHYGLNAQTRSFPLLHVRLVPHLLFSTNGLDLIDDAKKAHRLRRSFASGWRNARWRDMLLAFLWWVSEGRDRIHFPVSPTDNLVAKLPPYTVKANFSVTGAGVPEADDDDPDIDYDHWDDRTVDEQ